MVALLLKLLDQFTKLLRAREDNRREYFDRYVQPTFEAAEKIYHDYRMVLGELRKKIKRSKTSAPIIRFLERRRQNMRPARAQIRAILAQRVNEGRATRFEAGILGLLTGAATAMDRPYFQTSTYEAANRAIRLEPGRHTVLDILQKVQSRGPKRIGPIRNELLGVVDEKTKGIDLAWQNVVVGYAELHARTLPAAGLRSRRRAKKEAPIAEVQSLLQEIHDMIGSGRYRRSAGTQLEEAVTNAFPSLAQRAQDVRQVIHDLDNREPNITIGDLEDSLSLFEEALESLLPKRS